MEELRKLPFQSIIGALEYHSSTNPDRTAILYPNRDDQCESYCSLTYAEYNNVLNHLSVELKKVISTEEKVVCALILNSVTESLLYSYALLKLDNVIMFPISGRNSPAAIEHLLKETNTKYLLTTNEYLPMIQNIQNQNEQVHSLKILLLDDQQYHIENFLNKKNLQCSIQLNRNSNDDDEESNRVVVILHSSGSTSFPKPIYMTNRYFLLTYAEYLSVNKQFWLPTDVVLSWGALFHLLGVSGSVRCIATGCAYALPLSIQFPPKPDRLVKNLLVENGITVLVTVPTLLEQLIRELLDEKNSHLALKPLQQLRFVIYGGAGCPDDLCKNLIDNNVTLLSVYGSTETGMTLVNNYAPYDKRWKVMELPKIRKPFIRIITPENAQNPNEKIFIHLPNDPFKAENMSNTPDGCFVVGDVFLEDPPNSGKYLILGRQDDTLVHVNGEKTNPLPMEDIIRSSPFVKQVVIVGHKQFCTAVLVQLDFDRIQDTQWDVVQENIAKVVSKANQDAPSHSHLSKELIYYLSKDQILFVTQKGNIMRQKINKEYEELINQIYSDFFNQKYQKQKDFVLNQANIEKYLLEKFQSVLGDGFSLSSSIFDFSINSLQVVQLTNSISKDIDAIPSNFLYRYSTIGQIVEQLLNKQSLDSDSSNHQLTEEILNSYIELIKQDPSSSAKTKKEVKERIILLTGANGSLGSFVLRDLLSQPASTVKSVYCLLRGENSFQRLLDAFQQRKLDQSILIDQLNKRLFILPQSMNLNDQYFGQTKEDFQLLQNQVTDIIHLAWKVNFNQTVKDFQHDCIQGHFNLLKFSKEKNIQFHFISSIASAASGFLPSIKEEPLPIDSQVPLAQGYGQSKYIAEHIGWNANQFWNIPVNLYRVGQICGDTTNGVWNATELAPMMIYAAAGRSKVMPNQGEPINWIPMDICSSAIVDLALNASFDYSISNDQRVYHLVNPHSIQYDQYLRLLKDSGLQFDIVSKEEFIQKIFISNDLSNPLIKLSSFFQERLSNENKSKSPIFLTEKTVQKCSLVGDCPQIDSNLIQLFLNFWKQSHLLD